MKLWKYFMKLSLWSGHFHTCNVYMCSPSYERLVRFTIPIRKSCPYKLACHLNKPWAVIFSHNWISSNKNQYSLKLWDDVEIWKLLWIADHEHGKMLPKYRYKFICKLDNGKLYNLKKSQILRKLVIIMCKLF